MTMIQLIGFSTAIVLFSLSRYIYGAWGVNVGWQQQSLLKINPFRARIRRYLAEL